MKVLVTGVAGFVGSTLARRLLAEGYDVVGIDALTDYYDIEIKKKNLKLLEGSNFEFCARDINSVDLVQLLADVEVIYHQAGQPGVRKSWGRDFETYTSANISATQRLLEAAKESPSLKRFVYASSSSVYGDAETYPTEEVALPRPRSPYGVSKLAAEHLCVLYARNFNVPTVSLRYFTVYGPGQRPDMAFTRFTRALATGDAIELYGDGSQIRDFTYVDDIVDANVRAGQRDVPPGSVYNAAGGSNISLKDCLSLLEDISGKKFTIEWMPPVPGDVFRTGGSTERIAAALDWSPRVGIRQGLEKHYAWALANFGSGA